MFNFDQMALLHRHEGEWREMHEERHPSSQNEDVERRLLRGDKLFRCNECDLEIIAVPRGDH